MWKVSKQGLRRRLLKIKLGWLAAKYDRNKKVCAMIEKKYGSVHPFFTKWYVKSLDVFAQMTDVQARIAADEANGYLRDALERKAGLKELIEAGSN
jgi:hypothetical protein